MKKALVFALAAVLVIGLAVPAAAADVNSPVAPKVNEETTAPLPFLVSATSEEYELVTVEDVEELPAEDQKTFQEAQEALEEAVPEAMTARYFFFFKTSEPCTAVFRIPGIAELVVKQFVDGKWVELKATINGDGTITVEGVGTGPIAFFTK